MGFVQVSPFIRKFMDIEQMNDTGWAKTYLLTDNNSKSAGLIDPVYDFMEHYLEVLETRGLSLEFVVATHTHADHITACYSLRERSGCEYFMWKDTACLGISKYLDDGEVFRLGSNELTVHHVPGHTNDHILVETSSHLFTGDFLFNGDGGVGRDDLPSGRVHVHWDALSVLDRFEGHTVVCSGHDPPGTTMMSLDWNREHNPILSMTSFEDFREWQEATAEKLGGVSKIKTAIPANLFGELPERIPWLE